MADEELKKFYFTGGECCRLLSASQFELFGIKHAVSKSRFAVIRRMLWPVAAQQRMHAGGQLAQAKRLGHVVVGTQVQADDLVNLLAFGGEHQDQSFVVFGAKLLADVVSAQARQHNVEHDERGTVLLHGGEGLIASRTGRYRKAFAGKQLDQAKADIGVIFDDQNFYRRRFHCTSLTTLSGTDRVKQLPPPSRGE